ncbi:phage virion morphogenesis protein [Actinobacillus equuli subsp. haemolyticus]|uniref:phage virion morphogenesis protein n=1 Tax=Actinobacillus equuli TaxID=718 RepID=UPI0024466998|nr:phage virion morphogenesis protein [Actinobacillus equuli]WGE51136.1 phage virion morphogenesis protein [Actinobacillus equuli subsp. haemolyticus]
MSGVKVEINTQQLTTILNKAVQTLANPKAMFGEMGETLLEIHSIRFTQQQAPDGTPWQPLADWYRDSKKYNQDKILTLHGDLRGTLRYQADNHGVIFGSDRPYAAIHQFGGTIKPKNKKILKLGTLYARSIIIPARPWLGISADNEQRLIEIARNHLENAFNA